MRSPAPHRSDPQWARCASAYLPETVVNLHAVDPSDPSTWPPAALLFAEEEARRLAGTTEYPADLAVRPESELHFRQLMGDRVIGYHATRLLDHEIAGIRTAGLRRLTEQLVRERIEAARASSALSDAEADRTLRFNVFARGLQEHRENQVWFVLGRMVLDDDADGLAPLLSTWGGEGIRGGPDPTGAWAIGSPAIVVAALDLTVPERISSWTSLQKVCVATVLGMADAGAEGCVFDDIPASRIVDIWQPGQPEYDRLTKLVRT